MTRVLKEDYFTGVFRSLVFRSSPEGFVLSEPTAKAKNHIRFTTDPGVNYNVYLKHSGRLTNTVKTISGKRVKLMNCNVNFSPLDYDYLLNKFPQNNETNLVCLICTDKDLSETRLVMLQYQDAMKCLVNKTAKGIGNIKVTRKGNNHSYSCYGIGFKNKQPIKCPFDFRIYLKFERNNRFSA